MHFILSGETQRYANLVSSLPEWELYLLTVTNSVLSLEYLKSAKVYYEKVV